MIEIIKEYCRVLREKNISEKNGAIFNKIIFFNIIIRVFESNKLTEEEQESLIQSAILINKLYK